MSIETPPPKDGRGNWTPERRAEQAERMRKLARRKKREKREISLAAVSDEAKPKARKTYAKKMTVTNPTLRKRMIDLLIELLQIQ